MKPSLEAWIELEYRYAATMMLKSISAVDIVKARPGFGQSVRAAKGSIIASTILASYDPDPDYFFHWYRDSAVVIDALRLLFEARSIGPEALEHFADFLRFSLSLQKLDGRTLGDSSSRRRGVAADFIQFLRDDADLASAHGAAVAAESRVNPDGTLDISKWARPQHDGPPLTALALLRWLRSPALQLDVDVSKDAAELLRAHLAFTFEYGLQPSFDIWEEENGLHYYTLRVSAAALQEGAEWLITQGDTETAARYRAEAQTMLSLLDGYWLESANHYRSRVLASGARSTKELDIAVVLAAIHIEDIGTAHSVSDPRMQATLAKLESLFDMIYAINHDRAAERAPALGRYEGDVYYSGGAYYFSTLGAAEFCFRAALSPTDAQNWIRRGDAYLETVRAYTPDNGELSEQFDQHSGAQTSARHLAWSYAAFISCIAARRLAGAR